MTGTLFVVATPIGNLEDMSPRALRILEQVSLVAAEDTRSARRLLAHFGLNSPLVSHHEHNEVQRLPSLIQHLLDGDDIAVISEAGAPTISDPGFKLVREAHRHHIRVVGVPGPCAAITALSIAGLPTDRFLFLGFLPVKSARRRSLLSSIRHEPGTLVAYESPNRILHTLTDVEKILPDRTIALGRELTKIHEELLRGTPAEVTRMLTDNNEERLRGEMTLLISGQDRKNARAGNDNINLSEARGVKQLSQQVASAMGLPVRDVYRALSRLKSDLDGPDSTL